MSNCEPKVLKIFLARETIIRNHYQKVAGELPIRGLKDIGFEELSFLRFKANNAVYYVVFSYRTHQKPISVDKYFVK